MKTGNQITTDIYNLFRDTELVREVIGGKIYRGGLRPRDSKEEDMVVVYTTSNAERVQEGVVTLNIFVPFIHVGNGVPIENVTRCEALETALQDTLDAISASSDYLLKLKDAIHTQRDEQLKQSFVVARLSFKILNTNKIEY